MWVDYHYFLNFLSWIVTSLLVTSSIGPFFNDVIAVSNFTHKCVFWYWYNLPTCEIRYLYFCTISTLISTSSEIFKSLYKANLPLYLSTGAYVGSQNSLKIASAFCTLFLNRKWYRELKFYKWVDYLPYFLILILDWWSHH